MTELTECIKGGSCGWITDRPGWLIKFDYDLGVVERLKEVIMPQFREWHKDEKRWWVSEDYDGALDELFENFTLFKDQVRLL